MHDHLQNFDARDGTGVGGRGFGYRSVFGLGLKRAILGRHFAAWSADERRRAAIAGTCAGTLARTLAKTPKHVEQHAESQADDDQAACQDARAFFHGSDSFALSSARG
jgi:hypothetical protein